MKKLTLPPPDGGTNRPTIEYTDDANDQVLTEKRAVDVTTYVGTTSQFDHLNRRTKVIQPDPAGGNGPGPTIPRTISPRRVGQ